MSFSIGLVAERSGVAATTLRFYESEGLLSAPGRIGGRRRYDEGVFHRLEVIGLCKAAGFSLEEIRVLLDDDSPGRAASRTLAEAKLVDVDSQMATLVRAREIIECAMRCTCPSVDSCACAAKKLSGSPC
ncbi:MerR family transcriptional regulator [Mycobacterium sp. Root135]|uniref:MerR family transcriptional regulator n=1 Tax=Mycobacterium sp. Root135 TaxID=1736457 RepID=UPI0006F4C226|nr:MerR family transcriptional regulator [Mycobacterium sp. Root135]KQY09465.1 MerR family transcriptional regulator [Mycobacterium sp. Root135]